MMHETHLTLSLRAEALDNAQAWADRRGLKLTVIHLSHGETPSQPMLTRVAHGTLDVQLASARQLAREAAEDGLHISRIKIETAPDRPPAPQDAASARQAPTDRHFEHHLKLLLGSDDLDAVQALASMHDARLSRNARRIRDDGRHERFVTQRAYGLAWPDARARFDALRTAAAAAGLAELDREVEYVVYDSNESLDAGWLDAVAR